MKAADLKKELKALGTKARAEASAWFFKTGKGEYAEGDVFIGATVPETRKIAKRYSDLSFTDLERLLHSREHEFRLVALFILISQYERGDLSAKKKIHALYLNNTAYVNNWDLVDTSAGSLVGNYLIEKGGDISLLRKLAKSKLVWERRIAVVATFAFIRVGDPKPAFEISDMLMDDTHDLIHKATGWMLREAGKRCSQRAEEEFLTLHYHRMPRTMLRYAIERFPEGLRKAYLRGEQ